MASLSDLKAKLTKIENQIESIYDTAQEYSIVGSHSVKNPALKDLEAAASRLRRRIFRYHGYDSRTTPDFSDE